LATLEAPLEPAQSAGSRVIVNVPAGGTVRGPKINGTIIPPAGDWLTVLPDGTLRLDVRATIKTDDGEIILVTYSGAFAASKEVNDRFINGEAITYKDAYFITAPQFTTGSKNMNGLIRSKPLGRWFLSNAGGEDQVRLVYRSLTIVSDGPRADGHWVSP
jgi:Protein of unknown function (DUF3237)